MVIELLVPRLKLRVTADTLNECCLIVANELRVLLSVIAFNYRMETLFHK